MKSEIEIIVAGLSFTKVKQLRDKLLGTEEDTRACVEFTNELREAVGKRAEQLENMARKARQSEPPKLS